MKPIRYFAYAVCLLGLALGFWLLLRGNIFGQFLYYGIGLILLIGKAPEAPKKFLGTPREWRNFGLLMAAIIAFVLIGIYTPILVPGFAWPERHTPLTASLLFALCTVMVAYEFFRERKKALGSTPPPNGPRPDASASTLS